MTDETKLDNENHSCTHFRDPLASQHIVIQRLRIRQGSVIFTVVK